MPFEVRIRYLFASCHSLAAKMFTHSCVKSIVMKIFLLCTLLIIPHAGFSQVQDYVLGAGDQLQIVVWGFPEFSTSTMVRDDGVVSIPLIGEVRATGLSRVEFVQALKRKLAEYVQGDVTVTVSVMSSSLPRIAVLGAVLRPDNYPFAGETELLDVISAAGGYTSDANLAGIKIFRRNKLRPSVTIDLDHAMEQAELETLPSVEPGDVVYVPRQRNFIKEFGEYAGYVVLFLALFRLTEGS